MARDLTQTLQQIYNSEIHCTITWIWENGFEFAFAPYTELDTTMLDKWHHVQSAVELADAIHEAVLKEFPESGYARKYA